jgi:hypothetical protein
MGDLGWFKSRFTFTEIQREYIQMGVGVMRD